MIFVKLPAANPDNFSGVDTIGVYEAWNATDGAFHAVFDSPRWGVHVDVADVIKLTPMMDRPAREMLQLAAKGILHG